MLPTDKPWPVRQVLGVEIDCPSKAQLIDYLNHCIDQRQQVQIATINAEMSYSGHQDPALQEVLQNADIVIPDGIGVIWALGQQGLKLERLPGIELVEALMRQSAQKGTRLFILGSSQETLDALPQQIEAKFGKANVVGMRNGFFSAAELPALLEQIREARPDVLFVALGVPKQEHWLATYRAQLEVPVLMGVGGSFDVISGRLQRAPVMMQRLHLEWFYRLLQQPTRWRRMLALPKFVLKVLQTK